MMSHASIETMQSDLAYLMTRYSMTSGLKLKRCPSCAALAVVHHLQLLLEHPGVASSSTLNNAYLGLYDDWAALAQRHEQETAQRQLNNVSNTRLH